MCSFGVCRFYVGSSLRDRPLSPSTRKGVCGKGCVGFGSRPSAWHFHTVVSRVEVVSLSKMPAPHPPWASRFPTPLQRGHRARGLQPCVPVADWMSPLPHRPPPSAPSPLPPACRATVRSPGSPTAPEPTLLSGPRSPALR